MGLRILVLFLFGTLSFLLAGETTIRGTLALSPDGEAMLEMSGGKTVYLEGDKDTVGVIKDARLAGSDFEAVGEFVEPDRFRIGPIHEKSMWVYRHGKRHFITYWCSVCSIRSYTPGICWCCQEETELDLMEADASGQPK
jgi:hypothetical protein